MYSMSLARLLWVFSKYGWMGWWFLWVGSEIKEKERIGSRIHPGYAVFL